MTIARLGGLPLLLLPPLLLAGCASTAADRPTSGPGGLAADRRPSRPPDEKVERGLASWYGDEFHGRPTASGEIFDMNRVSAAHRTLPFGTVVRVTNLDNGRSLDVRINDRGPFVRGRILDLSKAAAARLDMLVAGVARVELRVLESSIDPSRTVRSAADLVVQAGAFLDGERAHAFARGLRGVDRRFRVYSAGGWYRVQARGLDVRRAEALVARLAKDGIEALVVGRR